MCAMSKPAAVFLALVSGVVTLYLGVMGLLSGRWGSAPADLAMARGIWIAFGAGAIITACAAVEASLRQASDT